MRPPVPWRLLFLAMLIVSLGTQPVFLLGAGFVQMSEEFGFSATGLGVLTASFWLTASVASPLLGRVVERIGWRRAIQINAIASSLLLITIAVTARSTVTLGALLMASASMYGFANPSANLALAEAVDPRRRALMFGLKHAGIPSSTLLAGLAVPLVMVSFGWRWAYVLASVLGLIVLALVPARNDSPVIPGANQDPRRRIAPLTMRRLVAFATGVALATWAATSLGTYLVAAAVDIGYSESGAGMLLFAGSVASITGRLIAGHVTDRLGSRGFTGVATMVGMGAIVFALLATASGPWFAVLIIAAFATGWGWPGLMTYAVVNANLGTVAASSAITQAGVFLGAGAGPLVLGWVADEWSFSAAWLVVAGALAMSAAIVSLVGRSAVTAR